MTGTKGHYDLLFNNKYIKPLIQNTRDINLWYLTVKQKLIRFL